MIVDINDFPSFYGVPRKVASVAEYILHAAYRARREREKRHARPLISRSRLLHRQDTSLVPAELVSRNLNVKRAHMH